ncbi:MAG: hypothetical protein M1830_002832 [Pleopsidium flavum]|nr:MAG: hypothetical protein M1830_002832 [Pleopsidium flavum]
MAIIMKKRRTGDSKSYISPKQLRNLSLHVQPSTTAQVHALEALLRNPIKFTPSTNATRQNGKEMSNTDRDITQWKANSDAEARRHTTVLRYLSRSWEYFIRIPPGLRPQGLDNPGPLCYRNVAVQALMHVPIFLNFLEEYHHPSDCQAKSCLACQLRSLKRAYWETYSNQDQHDHAVLVAYDAIHKSAKKLGWKEPSDQQHDTRDFYAWMLNWLKAQLPQEQRELITAMFAIITDIRVECGTCKTGRLLNRPAEPGIVQLGELVGLKNGASMANVTYCTFMNKREVNCVNPVCTDNGYKPAEEFITIPPEVIVLGLGRFKQTGRSPSKKKPAPTAKVTTKIDIPEWLNLSKHYGHPRLPRDTKLAYRLSSVIYHAGTLEGGHYFIIARGPSGNKWWKINDTMVESSSKEMALDHPAENPKAPWTPYILTYAKTPVAKSILAKV